MENLLGQLPPLEGRVVELVKSQDISDIIDGVLDKHIETRKDYDAICDDFYSSNELNVCKKLFGYCKKNLPYKEESENLQTVRTPAATIALGSMWGVDCKHYAGFIAGVLDAMNRKYDMGIDWCYRFASYDMFKKSPGHVFVVVDPGTSNEIWIDPVLSSFNMHSPCPSYITDKRVGNMLVSISGVKNQYANPFAGESGHAVGGVYIVDNPFTGESSYAIGSADQVGTFMMKVSPTLATIPVAGWAASAVAAVGGLLLKLFGGQHYNEGAGVIQLIKRFQFKVLGDKSVYTGGAANESYRDQARSWFSMVLGIPVYNWDDVLVLMGFFGSYGGSQNRTEKYPAILAPLPTVNPFSTPSTSMFSNVLNQQSSKAAESAATEYYRVKNINEIIAAYSRLYPELASARTAITNASARALSLFVTNTPGGVTDFSKGWGTVEDYLVGDQGAWGIKYPGNWKGYTVAPALIDKVNPDLMTDTEKLPVNNTNMPVTQTSSLNSGGTASTSTANNSTSSSSTAIKAGLGANIVPLLLLGGALVYGLSSGGSKHKVGASGNTNTLLLVGGLGLAAIFLMSRKSSSDAGTQLLQQQQQQLSALQQLQYQQQPQQQQQANVWSALPSVLDTVKDIFNW